MHHKADQPVKLCMNIVARNHLYHQSIELLPQNEGQKMMMGSDAIHYQHKVQNLQHKETECYIIITFILGKPDKRGL